MNCPFCNKKLRYEHFLENRFKHYCKQSVCKKYHCFTNGVIGSISFEKISLKNNIVMHIKYNNYYANNKIDIFSGSDTYPKHIIDSKLTELIFTNFKEGLLKKDLNTYNEIYHKIFKYTNIS